MPAVAARNIRSRLPQQTRLLAAVLYFVMLLCLARYLNGTFWPPYGLDGLWFYSAAAALLMGEFVLEPFFTRPADAIANGIAVLIAATTVSLADAEVSDEAAQAGRLGLIVVAATVVVVASLAIAFKDSAGTLGRLAVAATAVASRLGRAWFLFSLVLLASGYAAFADSSARVAVLFLAWFVIIGLAPVEALLDLLVRHRRSRPTQHGTVESLSDPGTLIARLPAGSRPELGGEVKIEEARATGTIVELTSLTEQPSIRVALDDPQPVRLGSRVDLTGVRSERPVIGHVAEGSFIEEMSIATVPAAAKLGLQEGRLVEVSIGDVDALYQIVGGEIVARSDGEIRRHLVRVKARKLGRWDAEKTIFEPVAWVPAPGSAVQLRVPAGETQFDERFVGHVPGTSYGIEINPHLAVTHNTAILGILGIGKTHLAWELIRRMLVEGIKVVVLDITGRYGDHFTDLCSRDTENRIAEVIEAAIVANVANRMVRDDQAGNLHDFEAALEALLAAFVAGDEQLLILNPNRFDVSRMEGKPYDGRANLMVHLTMVEVTRLIAEQLLVLVQSRPRDSQDESATLCLVLEEAHSLVPEFHSVATDAEKQATNGTVRAVLQGRKYGFGCLVVTQRTANVTKSILNQCNTIFGMRVYDATGMGFLENYIGETHAHLLASLQDRQAVVFGRASSCNSPLIVDLNDSTLFRDGYWDARKTGVPITQAPATDAELSAPPPAAPEAENRDDDIPF